jgi:response regulator of citrate/malate metabolism
VEKIRGILRLNQELKFSVRQIAQATQVSKTSVGEYLAEYIRSGLSYQDVFDIMARFC